MKQFLKALPKDGDFFKYLCRKFPHVSEKGVFIGSDTRKMMFDSSFEATMSTKENLVTKFLGNVKAHNYELIIAII